MFADTIYIYLPTASGPMPVAAVTNGQIYAVHSVHLNTPRRLTASTGQSVWQWAYSAFGDTKPTTAHNRFADLDVTPNPVVTSFADFVFKLRRPGQYNTGNQTLPGSLGNMLIDLGLVKGVKEYPQSNPSQGRSAPWAR